MDRYIRLEHHQGQARTRVADLSGIRPYCRSRHHGLIPKVYAGAFEEPAWPDTWDEFEGFDPKGVFVAEDEAGQAVAGFVICFQREAVGYISVLAVSPACRGRGLGCRLASAAMAYLRSLGLRTMVVDVPESNAPARRLYARLGFQPAPQ